MPNEVASCGAQRDGLRSEELRTRDHAPERDGEHERDDCRDLQRPLPRHHVDCKAWNEAPDQSADRRARHILTHRPTERAAVDLLGEIRHGHRGYSGTQQALQRATGEKELHRRRPREQ